MYGGRGGPLNGRSRLGGGAGAPSSDPRRMGMSSSSSETPAARGAGSTNSLEGGSRPPLVTENVDFAPGRLNHFSFGSHAQHMQQLSSFVPGGFMQMMQGVRNPGVMNPVNYPPEYAGQVFGMNTAAEVPNERGTRPNATQEDVPPREDRYRGVSNSHSVDGDQARSETSRRMNGSDPPSFPKLIHGSNTRTQQLIYVAYLPTPENESVPMMRKGPDYHKLSPPVHDRDKRPLIAKAANFWEFNLKAANDDIAAANRTFYRGDALWDDVFTGTRDILWDEHGMRYRCKVEDEAEVALVWDKVSRRKFRNMMCDGHRIYKLGKEIGEIWRPKWMEPPMFNIARKRWDSPEFQEESRKKSKNRGVKFNDEWEVVEKAPSTHIGGQLKIIEVAYQMESQGSSNCTSFKKMAALPEVAVGLPKTYPAAFRHTHVTNRKELEKAQSDVGSDEPPLIVQEKWVDSQSRDLYVKFTEHPSQSSETSNGATSTLNTGLWAECAGGVSHGTMRGISKGIALREAGLVQRGGRALPPMVCSDAVGDVNRTLELEKKYIKSKKEIKKNSKELKATKKTLAQVLAVLKSSTTTFPAHLFENVEIPKIVDSDVGDSGDATDSEGNGSDDDSEISGDDSDEEVVAS